MIRRSVGSFRVVRSAVFSAVLVGVPLFVSGQQMVSGSRQFPPGTITRAEDVPPSRLRSQLDKLPAAARSRAAAWLKNFHFTDLDLQTLQADAEGGIFYVDEFTLAPADAAQSVTNFEPAIAQAAVPVSPFPNGLVFHSRPDAPNVIYLNFVGATVSGTAWNSSTNPVFQATAFSTDSDFSTFSDAEQTAIKRIWERVAEDYAPFNVDVTTEPPSNLNSHTAMALITRNTDANGVANPSSTAGGIAYINVFGNSNYATYRPAWVYFNNLANTESYIAEAASHEIGHNLGLSHDGLTSGAAYYGGHGTGQTSWGPIMGTGYDRNVSQWSKGEYYLANNTQDDLAAIAGKLSYIPDDHGNTLATATSLVISGGTNIAVTTPETDPTNSNPANKGVLQNNTDIDVFSFNTGSGQISLSVNPWLMPAGTRGGNLDIIAELHDSSDNIIATSNPGTLTGAQLQTSVGSGTYYLFIRNTGTGTPLSSTPGGYTSYGSIGQYFISGYVAPPQAVVATVQLTVTANNPNWGSVTPSNATFPAGSSVQVSASPAPYYQFIGWTNGAAGTQDPLTVVLNNDTSLQAVFVETVTTNHSTPHWWLAANGYSEDFENAAAAMGANGIPLWQSYIAGLNPNDPSDQLKIALSQNPDGDVLNWNTVAGRVYTLLSSSDTTGTFSPVDSATSLPDSVHSFTNAPGANVRFYKLQVSKP